jgi:hypothetical protein
MIQVTFAPIQPFFVFIVICCTCILLLRQSEGNTRYAMGDSHSIADMLDDYRISVPLSDWNFNDFSIDNRQVDF